MQRAMVALVPQVVPLVMVLLVMPTGWFVCLSARGVGAGVGRLPVRVVVGAPGVWWAWLGAGVRVGVYVARVAGGLWASGALLPCVWWFVLSGGAWPACALRGCRGVWSAWVVSVWVFGVGCWLWACRSRGAVGRDGGAAGDVDGDGAAGGKGGTTAVLAVSGVGGVECGGVAGLVRGGWWCAWRRRRECCRGGGCCWWCCGRPVAGGGGGCGWTAWWLWCRRAALMMGPGFLVAGGRAWWW